MRGLWILLCLSVFQLQGEDSKPLPESASEGEEAVFPAEFTTKKGDVLRNCKVKRAEADALIIEHDAGVSKVSFFDVSAEIQARYGFDPVEAMEKYRRDLKVQRDLKWKRFWEAQKMESEQAAEQEREDFIETVRASWVPVEANVLQTGPGGAYVSAARITFVPTKTKSTLGFEIDGPMRKKLVPLTPRVIFIEAKGISGDSWQGYLEPHAHETTQHPLRKNDQVPSYRAVARNDLK